MTKHDAKLAAIVSYITIIGWIIALIMNREDRSQLASFHIRQTLMLMIASLVLAFIPFLGWLLSIAVFVLWIIGLIGAIEGKMKPVPILGNLAQDWFKGL